MTAGPTRALDTRGDRPLAPDTPREVDVLAPAGSVGVVATVAVVAGTQPGFLTAWPCGQPMPSTANLNFPADGIIANTVISGVGPGGLCLRSNVEAHAIVDVTGYLQPTGGLTYTALRPQRLLDTRETTSLYRGRVGARQVLELPVQSMPGMPASAAAVVANLTVVDADGPGFLTAFPCGSPVPNTSSLNYPATRALGALTVSALGGGSLCVFSFARAHVLVDVLGVWTGASTALPPTTPPGDEGDGPMPDPPDAGATTDVSAATDARTADGSAGTATDASTDDASGLDGGAGAPDAGDQPPIPGVSDEGPSPGCVCRVPSRAPRTSLSIFGLLWVASLRRRRAARSLREARRTQ